MRQITAEHFKAFLTYQQACCWPAVGIVQKQRNHLNGVHKNTIPGKFYFD